MDVDDKANEKSRRERRKEARLEKNRKKSTSWLQHQQSRKSVKKLLVAEPKGTPISHDEDMDGELPTALQQSPAKENNEIESHGLKRRRVAVKRTKSKFKEYLEMEMKGDVLSTEEDLRLERKLAKKLKVKGGRLPGMDDMSELLEGIPSVIEQSEDSKLKSNEMGSVEEDSGRSRKKRKQRDLSKQLHESSTGVSAASGSSDVETVQIKAADPNAGCNTKYIAPHLRRNESEEYAQIRRRLRGLLNRLSESNVESVTGQISAMFHSVGRSVGSQLIGEEVLSFCCGGPRGNEQYASVFAAFVAGMACSVGVDFGAKLIASLAKSFEDEYVKEDNLSLRNLTLLLSYLYKFGVCSSDLIYDFMITLSKRLTEVDVSTILTVLQSCGMRLRADDPVGMKNFISSVQSRVTELKASSGEDQSNISSKRMEFMLETICDIKNNKARSKEDTVQQTRIKKWLKKLRVDDISIRGLSWGTLLDSEKKGQWWLSGDILSNADNVEEVAGRIDMDVPEAQKMLQLAAAQRMNTDARRAIFCVIMSGEDYIDAFEKLLRLDLPGKQDREIIRVLVDCCLQERVFNKYYCVLASKLCSHDKNHKFTLQYCLWDHFKELESMELLRSMHLAKFVAEMVASFSISLAVLKAVDLSDVAQLTPKRIMHFRMLFEAIFEYPDKIIWNMFTRIAVAPEYESLRIGIEFFVTEYVVSLQKSHKAKFRIARKAFNNVEGVLM